jgi:hypothetical protein
MGGVIDTNQASQLPRYLMFTGTNQPKKKLTLAPFIFGEILLRANPDPTLELLRGFDITFGLEVNAVIQTISGLSEHEMQRFEPFVNPIFVPHYESFYSALSLPTERHFVWAEHMKNDHRRFCGDMMERANVVRQRLRRQGAEIEKYRDLNHAIDRLPSFKELVVSTVTSGGQRPRELATHQSSIRRS